ncbi:hypothetical protein H5410_020862 [Solanum commersonii]|uniref:Uncharacterized protein n=1 Tax=Solanum commersonii TaxID=4109 RepID=A0A9J5ZB38_SOLCO|nr:hypothetical protein H5410_020862 [Solanum commersonii]
MEGPRRACRDFNTIRHMVERRNCSRITNIMRGFSEWINDMGLHDSHFNRRKFTWFRGINHYSVARLDKFLFSNDWEEDFKDIRQRILHRDNYNHASISIDCGNWNHKKSYFRFENWRLGMDGFKAQIAKEQAQVWSRTNFRELVKNKNSLLNELIELDQIQDTRQLNEDTMMIRAEELAKNEEAN